MSKGKYKRTKEQLERLQELSRQPRQPRGGGYDAIHKWLRNHYGKADKCEGSNCTKKSKRYHWCLRKGCKYEHNHDNFIQLCSSCHRLYDQTKKSIDNARKGRKYTSLTKEHKLKISNSMKKYYENRKTSV